MPEPSYHTDRQRLRIRFRKERDLRWIGHRDLARCFERLFRRANLSLRMSEGFHPKPKISFPSALALGIEGLDEVLELDVVEPADPHELQQRLAAIAPDGLTITKVTTLEWGRPKSGVRSMKYRFPIPAHREQAVEQSLQNLLARSTFPVHREDRREPVDLLAQLESLALQDGAVEIHIRATNQASVRPGDLLTALGLTDLEKQGHFLTRTEVELTS